jgi:15-cis-phytoene synthase
MPQPSPERHANPDDLAACRALLRGGSRSFFAASFLLPRRTRDPATALYAFCRLADDAIDLGGDHQAALADLHARLDRIYAGCPAAHPVERAFAQVVAAQTLPRALPEALLDGFLWDAEGRQYETLAALEDYAARVAGAVGAMMAVIMGVRAPAVLARAADLGVAMQLTNIARDVGEDARQGRLYLPRRWLRETGIDPDAWLAAPVFDAALAGVVARLLDAAEAHYRRAETGIAALPRGCRPGIFAARLLYAEIGRAVAANGYDSFSRRAVVPAARKARLLARALAASVVAGPRAPEAKPLPANRFLVEALARGAPGASVTPMAALVTPAWWDLSARVCWVLDLFERLERSDRATAPAGDA